MRIGAITFLAVWLAGADAHAGKVSFDPKVHVIDLTAGDSPVVTFDLALAKLEMDGFYAIDFVVGSDNLNIVDFAFDPLIKGCFDCPPALPAGLYPSDLAVSFLSSWGPRRAPLALGTLTVDVTGLGPGSYELVIDPAFKEHNFVTWVTPTESLIGLGRIEIVPEPATLALLGFASLAVVCRRRTR